MSNSMMTIYPYIDRGDWVFDDDSVNLKREPFVFGVPEMINEFVKNIPGAKHGFKLYFSSKPFPGYQADLTWLREEFEGNWYAWTSTGQEGWICPALFKYFEKAPERIFSKAEAMELPLWK